MLCNAGARHCLSETALDSLVGKSATLEETLRAAKIVHSADGVVKSLHGNFTSLLITVSSESDLTIGASHKSFPVVISVRNVNALTRDRSMRYQANSASKNSSFVGRVPQIRDMLLLQVQKNAWSVLSRRVSIIIAAPNNYCCLLPRLRLLEFINWLT